MPTFLFGWYYFIGRLIERWFYKRARAKSTPQMT